MSLERFRSSAATRITKSPDVPARALNVLKQKKVGPDSPTCEVQLKTVSVRRALDQAAAGGRKRSSAMTCCGSEHGHWACNMAQGGDCENTSWRWHVVR